MISTWVLEVNLSIKIFFDEKVHLIIIADLVIHLCIYIYVPAHVHTRAHAHTTRPLL